MFNSFTETKKYIAENSYYVMVQFSEKNTTNASEVSPKPYGKH